MVWRRPRPRSSWPAGTFPLFGRRFARERPGRFVAARNTRGTARQFVTSFESAAHSIATVAMLEQLRAIIARPCCFIVSAFIVPVPNCTTAVGRLPLLRHCLGLRVMYRRANPRRAAGRIANSPSWRRITSGWWPNLTSTILDGNTGKCLIVYTPCHRSTIMLLDGARHAGVTGCETRHDALARSFPPFVGMDGYRREAVRDGRTSPTGAPDPAPDAGNLVEAVASRHRSRRTDHETRPSAGSCGGFARKASRRAPGQGRLKQPEDKCGASLAR